MKTKVTIKTVKPVTVMQEVEEVKEYPLGVFPVQYRNYPSTIHIQGTTLKSNRHYGFAFDIPGQSKASDKDRTLLSKAGTGQLYWNGTLVVNGTSASLIGANGDEFNVPLETIPFI